MTDPGSFGYGQLDPADVSSQFNTLSFIINQILARVRTFVPVKVIGFEGGGVAPPGIVSVQPMVNQLDGNSNATPHGTIFNIPVFRLQAGTWAIIIDPQVGDVGWMAICDRDISGVKATGQISNPGSLRKFDLADGVYFGGGLGGTPDQYFQMNDAGVTIVDNNGNSIAMGPTGIVVTGNLIVNNIQIGGTITGAGGGTYAGNITTTGTVTGSDVVAGAIHLTTHKHSGVTAGGANSGGPVP